MKIIAISGFKGGVAKSTSALHIARFLADKGKTLLIDSDPNRSCQQWADRAPSPPPFQVVNEKMAPAFISGQDFLVLDTPARPLTQDLMEISQGASLTILPTIPDAFSLQAMLSMLPFLHPSARFSCLLVVCPPPPSKEASSIRSTLCEAGLPLFHSQIRRAAAFAKAIASGMTVAELTGRDRLPWLDYQSLGHEILDLVS